MVCFLSHNELANLHYMYQKQEEVYQSLLKWKQENADPELQAEIDKQIEIARERKRHMLQSLT